MKKRLANYAIILSNYLSRIASQLDSRFRYFHINLPPQRTEFEFYFDNKETLNLINQSNDSGAIKKILELNGADCTSSPYSLEIDKLKVENDTLQLKIDELTKAPEEKPSFTISKDDIVIGWEHYRTNYVKEQHAAQPLVIDDDDDDGEEDDGDISIEDIFPGGISFRQRQIPIHYTPWGKFDADNPISPVNLYDLYMVHFKGFTTDFIPNFKDLMSSIEGIAIWGQIDRYCLIVAPAKAYEIQEVKYNFNKAVYSALGMTIENGGFDMEDHIISVIERSEELFKSGIDNFAVVFPEPNFGIEVFESPDEDKIKEIHDLMGRVKDLVVIHNGDFLG
jgi:hypothetical protein